MIVLMRSNFLMFLFSGNLEKMLQKKAIYNLLNILFAAVVHGSRSDLPKSIIAEGNFFRTAKMNFIWSKAIHHLSDKSILKAVKVNFIRLA